MSEKVESPCVRNCCLDENDVCLGCYRTIEEILNWQASSNAEKQKTLKMCKQRKVAHASVNKHP